MSVEQAYAHCEAEARAGARDRWLGALFAPPPGRRHLHALIAFELEMSRVRTRARDPRAGEIRLVWWREALTARAGEAEGNPVAAAMLDMLAEVRPPPHLIVNAIAGRQADLYDDSFAAMVDLEAYLGETRSGLLQIGARALGGGEEAAEASGLAGVALGLIGLLRDGWRGVAPADLLARHGETAEDFARRASPARAELIAFARRRLAEAQAARAKLPKALAPAYAELATAPLWLGAIERGTAPAAWRRQWALWRWMRRA